MEKNISALRKTGLCTAGGFTLLEATISILILGLILGPLLLLYNNYEKKKRIELTYERTQKIVDLVQNYRNANGAYPCPASLAGVPRGSPDYGHMFSGGACAENAPEPGQCRNGVCVRTSIRADASIPDGADFDRRVIIGAVPFRALQMQEKESLDAYGHKIVYAVTLSQTDSTERSIDDRLGAITLRDSAGNSLTGNIEGSGHYVVISPGPSGIGAYTIDGVLKNACEGESMAHHNCDQGFETGDLKRPEAIFFAAPLSTGDPEGRDYFDNTVAYYSQIYSEFWRLTENPANIRDMSPQGVGIGAQTTNQNLHIFRRSDVAGSQENSLVIGIEQGKTIQESGILKVNRICDLAAPPECQNAGSLPEPCRAHCFDVQEFIKNDLECTNEDEFMIGIAEMQPICGVIQLTCPESTPLFAGIGADGKPVCKEKPPKYFCEPAIVTSECGQAVHLAGTMRAGNVATAIAVSVPNSGLSLNAACPGNATWGECFPKILNFTGGAGPRNENQWWSLISGRFVSGACKIEGYVCGNDGNFHRYLNEGHCQSNNPVFTEHTQACSSFGSNYTGGNFSYVKVTFSCQASTQYCNPANCTRDGNGNIVSCNMGLCSASLQSIAGPGSGRIGACECAPLDGDGPNAETEVQQCSTYFSNDLWSGEITLTRTRNYAGQCDAQISETDDSNCQCNPPGDDSLIRTIPMACPADRPNGTAFQTQTFNSDGCSWVDSGAVNTDQCFSQCTTPPDILVHAQLDPPCWTNASANARRCLSIETRDRLGWELTFGNNPGGINSQTCQGIGSAQLLLPRGTCAPRQTRWARKDQVSTSGGNAVNTIIDSNCDCSSQVGQTTSCKYSGIDTLYQCKCE